MSDPHLKLCKGRTPQLTPMQEIELWAWYQAKEHLGSKKTKARELNVSESLVKSCIERMRHRANR